MQMARWATKSQSVVIQQHTERVEVWAGGGGEILLPSLPRSPAILDEFNSSEAEKQQQGDGEGTTQNQKISYDGRDIHF